eukprot:3342230-Pyramimonas_sp.AAC.1
MFKARLTAALLSWPRQPTSGPPSPSGMGAPRWPRGAQGPSASSRISQRVQVGLRSTPAELRTPRKATPVSYTHLTLPTILLV